MFQFPQFGEQRQITRRSRGNGKFTTKERIVVVDLAFSDALGPTAVGCTNYHDMIEFSVEIPDSFANLDADSKAPIANADILRLSISYCRNRFVD